MIIDVLVQRIADILELNIGEIPAPLTELGLMGLAGDRFHCAIVFDRYKHLDPSLRARKFDTGPLQRQPVPTVPTPRSNTTPCETH